MPYFQLRITLSPTRNKEIVLRSIHRLRTQFELSPEASLGYEELNKYGEPCDPHIHFNFITHIDRCNPKRCIQDWLRRYFISRDVELKGNKQWSLQMVEEPKDFVRWLRYTWKENPLQLSLLPQEIEGKSVQHWIDVAQSERTESIAANILQREKLRNKDKFKEQMYIYVEQFLFTESYSCGQRQRVWELIFDYYRSISKPINFTVIEGYTNLFLADHDHLSPRDAYILAHSNN